MLREADTGGGTFIQVSLVEVVRSRYVHVVQACYLFVPSTQSLLQMTLEGGSDG